MDYTTLVASVSTPGSIASWLNHTSLQTSAPMIIEEAESFIYRRLRHFRMKARKTGAFTIGSDAITLLAADRYLQDIKLIITGINNGPLTRKPDQEVIDNYQYDGSGAHVNQQPQIFYTEGDNFQFDSPSDQAYPYLLLYYKQPDELSVSNTTNFLTTFYPRLMRCACMAGAAEFMKDAGLGNYDRTYWEQLALTELDIAQAESDQEHRSVEAGMILT